MGDVIVCKGGDCEVAVVVVGLVSNADARVDAGFLGGLDEILGQELPLFVEVVSGALAKATVSQTDGWVEETGVAEKGEGGGTVGKGKIAYDIYQQIKRASFPSLDQFSRVVLSPSGPPVLLAEIAPERLLPPRGLQRVRNGGKGTAAPVHARVLEVHRQGAVATHAVPADAQTSGVDLRELGEDDAGKLGGDVRVHPVVVGPRGRGRVDVESRARAQVVRVVLPFDVQTSWGVGFWFSRCWE